MPHPSTAATSWRSSAATLAIERPDCGGTKRLFIHLALSGELFYLVALTLAAVCFALLRRIVQSPFGRMLTVIRDNPERAEFIGVDVRLYELAAFVVAGLFAGLSGALFGIFNRGVFSDFAYWTRSAERE